MNIDWLYFLIAIVLLWLPRQFLRMGRKVVEIGHRSRRKGVGDTNPAKNREPGDPSISFLAEIGKPRNFVDFFRAVVGSVVLLGTFPGIEPALRAAPGSSLEEARLILYGQIGILLVGVVVQMFRFEHRVALFPPLFYLAGLTIGMCGLQPALFALVLVWVVNFGLPNPAAFLVVHALLILTFGLLFRGLTDKLPFVAAFFLFLPVLASLLSRRRLVLFTKRVKVPGSVS